eukprot:386388_1
MQLNFFVAFVIIFITIANGSSFSYTSTSPLSATNAPITCATGSDCDLSCHGILSCFIQLSTGNGKIYGPSGNALTINIDGEGAAFNIWIYCEDCSSLTINVNGDVGSNSYVQFLSHQIYTPRTGLTTLDCSGAAGTAGRYACGQYSGGTIKFDGANGFGTGPGQVYIKDVTNTAGRLDTKIIQYRCYDTPSSICRGWEASEGMQLNPAGYVECAVTMDCQVAVEPGCVYSLEDYLDNCYCGSTDSSTTISGSTDTIPLKSELFVNRGDTIGFVKVSEFDYYFMRACMVIVLVGFCVVIIRAFMVMINDCNKQTVYKYTTDDE